MGKGSSPKIPTVVSRPEIFSSINTSESNRSASARAFEKSEILSTNCKPTLEPCRAGLRTTGGSQPIGQLATEEFNKRKGAVGTPAAIKRCLLSALSKAILLDSASQPV